MLSEEEWFRFVNGGYSHPLEVCRLRPALVKYWGVETSVVRISPQYASKLHFRHRLTPEHLALMRPTIEQGKVLQENPSHLIFYKYHEDIANYIWVVVKSALNGREIWICTCHRQRENEIARKSKKCVELTF